MEAAKVTVPVPRVNAKNFPTLRNPSWVGGLRNTLPFPRSFTSLPCVAACVIVHKLYKDGLCC